MKTLLGKLLVITVTVAALQAQVLYKIDTFAGSGEFSFTAEGSLAAEARMVSPIAVAVAPSGDVYFTESFFHQIFRVGADGRIHRFAGTGEVGSSGDGGPALSATLDRPFGLDVDATGVVYFCDANTHRIRSIGLDGIIRTVAGTGAAASTGDGGLALNAQIINPRDVVIDRTRNVLYFSEVTGGRVRKIDLATGIISLVAGTGVAGSAGDGGPAVNAQLNQPVGLGLASDGALLIADRSNAKVRRVTLAGIITTVAGTGVAGVGGDGGVATAAQLLSPNDVLGNPDGSFLIADLGVKARMVNAGGVISVFGDPSLSGSNFLTRTADDAIISVVGTRRLVRFKSGATTAFAGFLAQDGIGDGGPAKQAKILAPHGIAVNKLGEVFVGDALDVRIRGINSANVIRTAGQGTLGVGLAADSQSRLHSTAGATVLRFTPQGGVAATVAGTGAIGSSGDGGPATAATLTNALALAFDADDNLYIADVLAHRVRRVAAATGTITTVAGTGVAGYSGDGGAASAAQLNSPNGLAVGPDGTLYIADKENNRVRAVKNGVIRTFAGNGLTGVIGDGIPAVDAEVGGPFYVAADAAGSVYITSGQLVRKVFPDGIIRNIAGTVGAGAFSGDGGPATSAKMSTPTGIAVDSDGVVYVADQLNGRVRSLEPVNFFAEGVVNGASFKTGISPGGIASIFGVDIGPEPAAYGNLDGNLRLETTVGGVQVLFNGVAAPIFFASSGQLNVQAPYEIAGSPTVTIKIIKNGVELNSAVVPVEASGPGIFAVAGGTGQVVALNQDGSLNSAGNPEQAGRVVVLYVTGGGVKSPALGTGELSTAPFPTPVLDVEVKINGVVAPVQFAAAAPGFVGLMQINAVVPPGTPAGAALSVIVRVGERSSPEGTTIAVGP